MTSTRVQHDGLRPANGWLVSVLLPLLASFPATAPVRAQEPLPHFTGAAAKVQAAVVTVRVSQPARPLAPSSEISPARRRAEGGGEQNDGSPPPTDAATTSRVSVTSGVSLGRGLVVSTCFAEADATIRLTLPGGRQSSAQPRVIDEYSGLTLLEIDRTDLAGLEPHEELPEVGSWVLGGAAWGAEKAVVSVGIVGGLDRSLPGSGFPPLVQCGLAISETSSGGPIVDQAGRLLGIIVLADAQQPQQGVFAVPVAHVQRLLRSHRERREEQSLVVLKRRRPTVGMVLGGNPDEVEIVRIEPGGPAEVAGLKVGDQVVAVNQLRIRSVYQALQPVLMRQPGDQLPITVIRQERELDLTVTLGGGVELPRASVRRLAQYVEPKVELAARPPVRLRGPQPAVGASGASPRPPAEPGNDSDDARIRLLEEALDRYRSVIVYQQGVLAKHYQEQLKAERTLRELQQEVASLKRQLDQGK